MFRVLLLLFHDFRIDDRTFVLLRFFGLGFGLRLGASLALFSLGLGRSSFVKFGGNTLPDFVQLLARSFDGGGVTSLECFLDRKSVV